MSGQSSPAGIRPFESSLAPGFRRMAALGAWRADALRQVRDRGLPAALEMVATMGGVGQAAALARSLVLAAKLVDEPVDRLVQRMPGSAGPGHVEWWLVIRDVSWEWRGGRQRAVVGWQLAHVVSRHGGPPWWARTPPGRGAAWSAEAVEGTPAVSA